MILRGLSAWGIQIGSFAAGWAPFVLKCFKLFHLHTGEANSYYPRGPIMGKGNSPNFKIGWDRGFSVPWAFKLYHLHPFGVIWWLKRSTIESIHCFIAFNEWVIFCKFVTMPTVYSWRQSSRHPPGRHPRTAESGIILIALQPCLGDIQGDPCGWWKPPADLDLGCSA